MIDTKVILSDPETDGSTLLHCTVTRYKDRIRITYPNKRDGFIIDVPIPAVMAALADELHG